MKFNPEIKTKTFQLGAVLASIVGAVTIYHFGSITGQKISKERIINLESKLKEQEEDIQELKDKIQYYQKSRADVKALIAKMGIENIKKLDKKIPIGAKEIHRGEVHYQSSERIIYGLLHISYVGAQIKLNQYTIKIANIPSGKVQQYKIQIGDVLKVNIQGNSFYLFFDHLDFDKRGDYTVGQHLQH